MKRHLKNSYGFAHTVLLPVGIIIITGIVGVYIYLANSNALIPNSPAITFHPWSKLAPATAVERASHPYRYTNESLAGLCGRHVAIAYGYSHLGMNSAKDFLNYIKSKHVFHTTRNNIPYGALVFFNAPVNGHVAIYAGDDNVWTVDYNGRGKVSKVSIKRVVAWAGAYQGWARAADIPNFHP